MTTSNSKFTRHSRKLSEVERGKIQALLDAGITNIIQIIRIIKRSKSTVSPDDTHRAKDSYNHASTCLRLLQQKINKRFRWFKTITFDKDSEFSELSQIKDYDIYFALRILLGKGDTNESCNGLLRQFF